MDPVSRSELIRRLRQLGFDGPFVGGKHQVMIRGRLRVPIPNPHVGEVGRNLLARLLRQAQVTESEWEATR